jgi:hypothetical protein
MPNYKLRLGNTKVSLGDPSKYLQGGEPQTEVDSGGSLNKTAWQGQDLDRNELRKVKDIRESGGLVATLFEKKALMKFGTSAELQSENDDLQEWLADNFGQIDLTTLDLGSDAIWYPYGLGEVVETRGGDFSHIECIEPWTMLPKTDNKGNIRYWEQETQHSTNVERYTPDEIGQIVLNKASGRDKIGVSEVLRSEQEITQYRENQDAINKAVEIAGFPHHVWTVGSEGMTPINDNDLRRVRNNVDNMDGDTQFVVGPDIEHDKITPADFDFESITKRDLRMLTTAIGVPLELAGYGREGLGSGSEAQLIMDTLALENEVSRRRFETQFIENFVRPIVEEYSPFNPDEQMNMQIRPFLDQKDDVADLIQKIGAYMKTSEVREKLDLPEVEDSEIAESYRTPKQIEEAEEEDQEEGGLDQIFNSETRNLAEIPDKIIENTDLTEDDFVPNSDVESVVSEVTEFIDEHGLPNPDNQQEGATRANQLLDHAENGEPLEYEYWEEISNFHARHRAQDNHECDESSLPEEATEIDNSEYEECYFDPGYFSDKTWGGDPGKEQADRIVDAVEGADIEMGDSGNVNLAGEDTPDWDRHYLNMLENVAWADATDRTLIGASEVPDMVQNRLRDTILGGTLFGDIESIPSSERMQLREFMLETLTDKDGWTTDELTNQIEQLGVDRDRAEMIARTETASAVNTAREEAYSERGLEDAKFKWVSQDDDRRTDACAWLTEQTEDGVSMDKLKDLIDEAPEHDPDMQNDLARPENFVVHPNERSTWTRVV